MDPSDPYPQQWYPSVVSNLCKSAKGFRRTVPYKNSICLRQLVLPLKTELYPIVLPIVVVSL
jgi:hypothetical protein